MLWQCVCLSYATNAGLPQLGRSQNLDDFQISHFNDFSGVQTTRRRSKYIYSVIIFNFDT